VNGLSNPVLLAADAAAEGMTAEAWAFMLSVWGVIIGMTVYCFYKLLVSERKLDGEGD
jgi:hypothetical protein